MRVWYAVISSITLIAIVITVIRGHSRYRYFIFFTCWRYLAINIAIGNQYFIDIDIYICGRYSRHRRYR